MCTPYWRWRGRNVPMSSLLDLFLFIARDLDADYSVQKERKYFLVRGSLTVGLDIRLRGSHFHEVMDIQKIWKSSATEHIVYSMDYDEPTIAEGREREKMKTEPGGDWSYQIHLKTENRDRYLSNEMYADNVHILCSPLCKLSYETSRLDRGLRSLAHLKFSPNQDSKIDEVKAFPAIFVDMMRKTEWLLTSQLGPDKAKWPAALRKGKADIDILYAREIKGVFPVSIVGRYLFDLCRIYGKPPIN